MLVALCLLLHVIVLPAAAPQQVTPTGRQSCFWVRQRPERRFVVNNEVLRYAP